MHFLKAAVVGSIASLFATVLLLSTAYARADERTPQSFNIGPQSLGAALSEFARQSHEELLFAPEAVANKSSHGVRGTMEPLAALEILLTDSGLTYSTTPAGAILVGAPGSASASPQVAPSGAPQSPGQTPPPGSSLQLAQLDQAPAGPQVASSESLDKKKKAESLDEVVVTGTHLRAVPPASPVIELTSQDIQASGYSSTSQLFESLPQNFNIGGPNYSAAKGESGQGYEPGASRPNLRGLGDATLVLVNGHRISRTGTGNSYDVSTIPIGAIDHIEIVTDGASAIYGADAVAGVVNIILKKQFEGVEVGALGGWTSDGGGAEQQYNATAGHNWSTGNALVSYTYNSQRPIFSSERDFSPAPSPTSLAPKIHLQALTAQLEQQLTNVLSVHGDALYADRSVEDSLAANSTLWYDTRRSTKQYTINAGARADLPKNWQFTIDSDYSRSRSDGAQLDTVTETSAVSAAFPYGLTQSQYDVESQANGRLASIYSGDIKLAAGAGYRRETLADSSTPGVAFSASRNISYGYVETQIPLVLADSSRVGLERLELSASERYDHYSDFGGRADGKLGIIYKPFTDITLRATWATAFRAPALEDVYSPGYFYLFLLPDTGTTSTVTAYTYGYGNKGLKPETSESWSATLDYTPSQVPELALSTTAFHYDFRNKVALPIPTIEDILTNPLYEPFVVRDPSQSTLASFAATAIGGVQNFAGPGVTLSDVRALALDNPVNLAKWTSEGADLTVKFRRATSTGAVGLQLGGTYLDVTQQAAPGAPKVAVAGTVFNPPRFKARAGVDWQIHSWQLSGFVNYVSAETDNIQVPNEQIASFTTADFSAAYTFTNGEPWRDGWMIRATVINAFDRAPPRIAATTPFYPIGYDATNASPVGRLSTIEVGKRW